MSQVIDQPSPNAPSGTDLVAAIHQVLAASDEPLTISKLRAQLPAGLRRTSQEELTDVLRRQVAANALHQYPPYRSQQDRFWDRSMPVHIAALLRESLAEGPLPWSQLRRRLPVYAMAQAETVLNDQLAQGRVYRHPRGESRGGDRFGLQPPDPKEYLKQELSAVFHRLEQIGFNQSQVRVAALDILHDEEWAPEPPAPRARPQMDASAQSETVAAAPGEASQPGGSSAPNVAPSPGGGERAST